MDKTNELRLLVNNKINDRANDRTWTNYFPSVNRLDPRQNMSYEYISKHFPEEPKNMIGIRDVPLESNLYDIEQRIGEECDFRLGVIPTTQIRTNLGLEPQESESYWKPTFDAVEDYPVQPFSINEITKSLNENSF